MDLMVLTSSLTWEAALGICNRAGLLWWARVETLQPNSTYWFGPFLTRRDLNNQLPPLLEELTNEGASFSKNSLVRCYCKEPLTI